MDLQKYVGETSLYDKKTAVERKKVTSWFKSVSAFANGWGGQLLFGITEDNQILGLDDYKSDSEFISETIKSRMDPTPDFDMEIEKADGRGILVLRIFPGNDTPYFVSDGGNCTAYKRVGN